MHELPCASTHAKVEGAVGIKERLQTRRAKERRLRKHNDLLLQSVCTHILPKFIQQGFSASPQVSINPVDPKSAGTFPFDLLRRVRPDGGFDLVEIQFMTYQRAAFRINVCAVPKDGMMTLGGDRAPDELKAGGLHDHFEMYDCPRWRRWFSVWFWRFRTPVQSDYDKLALEVAGFLTEVELALREGRVGPHMRRVVIPRRTPLKNLQGQGAK
jgi:hypothetical protein